MRALVREIPDSFVRALAKTPAAIDVVLAREQHASYRAALAAGMRGGEVIVLPADEECPDCVFVEDTAVIVGKRALITRPGAPSRHAETPAIAAVLRGDLEVIEMEPPATLDGGDVMVIDNELFVSASTRTNSEGIAALRRAFQGPMHRVQLPADVLHLKCVVSPLDEHTIALADDTIPAHEFLHLRVVRVPHPELYAANVVALPRHIIIAEGYPRTQEALEAAGYRVWPVPVSEVRKADGSLTCQSLLWG